MSARYTRGEEKPVFGNWFESKCGTSVLLEMPKEVREWGSEGVERGCEVEGSNELAEMNEISSEAYANAINT